MHLVSENLHLSNNTSVATVSVDGTTVTVTPKAVGSAKITVTAGADTYYPVTASAECTVTFTAPAGSTTAPSSEEELFNEAFSNTSNTGGRDGSYNGTVSSTVLNSGNNTHTDESWTGITYAYANNYCSKVGKTSESGTLTSGNISFGDDTSGTLTFSAAGWVKDNTTYTGTVTITNAKFKVNNNKVTSYEFTPTQGQFDDFEVEIVDVTDDITLTFSGYCYFLDDVKVTKEGPAPTATVTLNTYGYATYASVYPLDFSKADGYTAWRLASIDKDDDNKMTFEKVTSAIKGGQGILLKGDASDEITLYYADSEDAITTGLTAVLADTYLEAGLWYGLSGKVFKKNNAGVVKANKAIIPASSVNAGSGVSKFVFVDETTGITTIEEVSREVVEGIFDLQGRRLAQPQKGINIINGKKVVIK